MMERLPAQGTRKACRCSPFMATSHPKYRQVADFLAAMGDVLARDFNYVVPLAAFAGIAFMMAGVPDLPALVTGLCIGCGIVAFLAAKTDKF